MARNASNELPSMRKKVLQAKEVFSLKKLSGDISGCVRIGYCRNSLISVVSTFQNDLFQLRLETVNVCSFCSHIIVMRKWVLPIYLMYLSVAVVHW